MVNADWLGRLRSVAKTVAWSFDDVDDLAQEAAARLHRVGLTEWNELSYVVAKRAMIDWQRLRYGRRGSARAAGGEARWRAVSIDDPMRDPEWPADETWLLADHDVQREFDRVEARVTIPQMPWRRLTDRELYVWERRAGGATLREIGGELGVTESRVCQILSRTRQRLLR